MDEQQKELAKVIEKYFGADAAYLDIDVFTLAKQIMEAGWTKPVRCKDCKHWNNPYCNHSESTMLDTKADNFCSYGERRDGE